MVGILWVKTITYCKCLYLGDVVIVLTILNIKKYIYTRKVSVHFVNCQKLDSGLRFCSFPHLYSNAIDLRYI